MGRRPFSWSDLPQRPEGYTAPIIYGQSSIPASWVPSEGHARLAEWIGWQIAGYGSRACDRVVFCAMPPGSTSWRYYVDLDRGEWQAWGKSWQPRQPTAEPRSICQIGEYPEPQADWSADQLEGWRTVREEGGTVCGKFGPDTPEQQQQWSEWLTRVRLFSRSIREVAS